MNPCQQRYVLIYAKLRCGLTLREIIWWCTLIHDTIQGATAFPFFVRQQRTVPSRQEVPLYASISKNPAIPPLTPLSPPSTFKMSASNCPNSRSFAAPNRDFTNRASVASQGRLRMFIRYSWWIRWSSWNVIEALEEESYEDRQDIPNLLCLVFCHPQTDGRSFPCLLNQQQMDFQKKSSSGRTTVPKIG